MNDFGFDVQRSSASKQPPPPPREITFPEGCPSCGNDQQFVSAFRCVDCGEEVTPCPR